MNELNRTTRRDVRDDAHGEAVREATERVAAPVQSERAKTESAFIFRVGSEWYSLPTSACDRVIDESRTHSVPHRGGALIGIGNIAGDLLPVVSLSVMLGVQDSEQSASQGKSQRTVLFTWKNSRFAMPVSEVYGVHRLHADERSAPPATLSAASVYTTAILDWNGHAVGCLDPERLFNGIVQGIA